jgi:hypothetical protein
MKKNLSLIIAALILVAFGIYAAKAPRSDVNNEEIRNVVEGALIAEKESTNEKNKDRVDEMQSELEVYFTGQPLKTFKEASKTALTSGHADKVYRMTSIDFTSITIGKDTANVSVDSYGDWESGRFGHHDDLKLKKIDGKWKIYEDKFRFLPGYEP